MVFENLYVLKSFVSVFRFRFEVSLAQEQCPVTSVVSVHVSFPLGREDSALEKKEECTYLGYS